jgi:hypothetical protein
LGVLDVGIVTHESPTRVRERIAEHRAACPDASIVVVDGSRSDAGKPTRALTTMLGARFVGEEEKTRLVDAVAANAREHLPRLRFALGFGVEGAPRIGANRNALLLLNAGRRFCSFDDDIAPVVATLEGANALPTRSASADPRELCPFRDRDELRAALTFDTVDYGAVLDAAMESFLEIVVPNESIVALCFGHAGDIGTDKPFAHLVQQGHARSRLMRGGFAAARQSREVTYAVRSPTLTRPTAFMAGAVLFDGRARLPPFFPFGRNEDGALGALLFASNPGALVGRLPQMMFHVPCQRPAFGRWTKEMLRPRICDLLATSILASEEHELDRIGESLIRQSCRHDFGRTLGSAWRQTTSRAAESFRQLLREYAHEPAAWANDVCDLIDAIEDSLEEDVVVRELAGRSDVNEALPYAFRAYGELLVAWTDIWRAAVAVEGTSWLGR